MAEDEIFQLLDKFRLVVPQGSPMSGIGNDNQIQSISKSVARRAREQVNSLG